MVNVKTTLDTRRAKSDKTFNVIFRITDSKKVYTINSGIAIHLKYWDSSKRQVSRKHTNSKLLNLKLIKDYYKIEEAILMLDEDFTIDKLRERLGYTTKIKSNQTFKQFSEQIITEMIEVGRTGNALVYQTAVNRLTGFVNDDITFEAIDYKLLTAFEHDLKLSGLKQNSVSNYFRSIRALYNLAIKHKIVERSLYPFHDISIKYQRTAKRAISKDDISKLNKLTLIKDSKQYEALQYFMLSFYLRGMSFTDLAYLKPSNIINDRLEYKRRKTHKNYSVRVFIPAKSIISRFSKDDNTYLLPVLPNIIKEDSLEAKKIIHQWIKTTNKHLKQLAAKTNCQTNITTYTSRHAFATIGKHLGYSNELIAEALGHQYGNNITNMYLDVFDNKVLDEMHKKIIL